MALGDDVIRAERTIYTKLKWAAGIVSSFAILAGAVAWAGDTRWAKIEDVRAWDSNVVAQIKHSTDYLRKQALEDKIYEITVIPEAKRTDTQRALLDRAKRQLEDINRGYPMER